MLSVLSSSGIAALTTINDGSPEVKVMGIRLFLQILTRVCEIPQFIAGSPDVTHVTQRSFWNDLSMLVAIFW
jgi:hypothetical protein